LLSQQIAYLSFAATAKKKKETKIPLKIKGEKTPSPTRSHGFFLFFSKKFRGIFNFFFFLEGKRVDIATPLVDGYVTLTH
jgi:hypothetical protein